MTQKSRPSRATELAQAGHFIDERSGDIVPPIHSATTFARDGDYNLIGKTYQRAGTPAWELAEQVLASIEGGEAAQVYASGLAAATSVFEPLRPGSHVVAPKVMYYGVQDWLHTLQDRRGIELTLIDPTDLAEVREAVRPGQTAWLWVESLANPTWDVIDIAACAEIAHKAGARLGVDATVTPPVSLRPIEHGADLVFHSATKYLNGHSDVMAGALITAEADPVWDEIAAIRAQVGGILGPFEAWLLVRGMRTLSVRFHRASENAMAIARHFEGHPALSHMLYAGLPSHPGHDIAARQMTDGFGGMLSMRFAGGEAAARHVATQTKVIVPATSLGGVESLVEHRYVVEGVNSIVPRDLLRFSIGIEDAADLIADLEQAFDGI
ncbi:MAG: PLP-dependent aspartate aminotransferase family protein [Pseudomonadota bacterium]